MSIPSNWYIAELVLEITVAGDDRNVVHRNHILVSASSSEEAYKKATIRGRQAQTTYANPSKNEVRVNFIGIADLDLILEPLEDGSEVLFHYKIGVPKRELNAMIPTKKRLRAFAPKKRAEGPDYASAEVVDLLETTTGLKRP